MWHIKVLNNIEECKQFNNDYLMNIDYNNLLKLCDYSIKSRDMLSKVVNKLEKEKKVYISIYREYHKD